MNKQELITRMSEVSGQTKKETELALKTFMETVIDTLADGDKIQLVGFGTFEVAYRKARTGRNPKTGIEMPIEAKNAPKFKAGKLLKDAVK